ncbi:MAG TPA: indolepyruvate ferredoxin oxidoreductase subunit alpha [Thermotogota bacterium]|jgi:indolepyruvate ferredoxin oxidoreductase alpha subunit|nr:indolepyruvate ferredoxin oxidoreductase subunit alpha [Thermotogota bacterium]NLH18625.1 indolepyruvate ferredoxin oxidoreductase subunit alpha [Thermotogaceae bacterium]OQC32719.1 MAG: 2-oxoacid ferredoxin oxidoreductase [Thermotogota bacterium ADurb.Bin062]HNW46892.1 indolepyruvate ferredoxin oxidoreductase subunit alpha [Thermotogota bacterium]HNY82296.1 indolepyruvate ferredoxin oxidoreductase subunit alpha [Thermotogota bacterium]
MGKVLLSGNEACARGAYEAGVQVACGYPGTPSTEILESLARYREIDAEWSINEKVALEIVFGSAFAGLRSLATMKNVGLNVAADPLFSGAYLGVEGGCVILTADDPGLHSSQTEQDNRHYAVHAKVPLFEPSDSQEAKDMMKMAFEVSERHRIPVLFRMTTRVCHSKGLVELGERIEKPPTTYRRDLSRFVATPARCRVHHAELELKLKELEEWSNETELNFIEPGDSKTGVITSGIAYQHAREVFGSRATYLKLGFTYPLPSRKILDFARQVENIFVIEENDPFIENHVKALGIRVIGKEHLPLCGELNSEMIATRLLGEKASGCEIAEEKAVARPPILCSGCPHRGVFYELSLLKDTVITGDIGCYTLGSAEPLNAMDTVLCMGAGISAAIGFERAFQKIGRTSRVIGVIGDSTFFHSGITGLADAVFNRSQITVFILDNRSTAMTGHQNNHGTGLRLSGKPAREIEIGEIVKALGVQHFYEINPNDLAGLKALLVKTAALEGPVVILAQWPCALLKELPPQDRSKFELPDHTYTVQADKCKKCKKCLALGCPSISFVPGIGSRIDESTCKGCSLCYQVCPFHAIQKSGDRHV